MRAWGPPFTSVYAYRQDGDTLRLDAQAGRPTVHRTIPVGTGVCGVAAATGLDQHVPDVMKVARSLAWDAETRAELVVIIRRGGVILGQLALASDAPGGFSNAEREAARQVADALAVLL